MKTPQIEASGEFLESARECAEKILKNHGDTCKTFKLAESFLKERDELVNTAPRDESGELESERDLDEALDECEKEFQNSLAHEYACMLDRELTYQMSDECVDDSIRANEYTFTEDGKRF